MLWSYCDLGLGIKGWLDNWGRMRMWFGGFGGDSLRLIGASFETGLIFEETEAYACSQFK